VGKCALEAASALEEILGDVISGGVVLYIAGEPHLKKIVAVSGTHPFPTDANVSGSRALAETLFGLTEDDLVLFVVSGGGSTLLCLPQDVNCSQEATIVKALMKSGASIQEVNTVRKHLSLARGGYLAQYAYPARVVSLVFSDVPGDDVQFVASGPLVRDETSVAQAQEILARYSILQKCNLSSCGLVETPKEEKYFSRVSTQIVVSGAKALEAMAGAARSQGLKPIFSPAPFSGEARDVGKKVLEDLHRASRGNVFLYSGESTVVVDGSGRGGRNLELALSTIPFVLDDELIVTVATDGHDNGPFAGAVSDARTREEARSRGVDVSDCLSSHNSYPFFEKAGSYIMTEETGSNVSDVIVALKY
jgi:glycerate-2-kinase